MVSIENICLWKEGWGGCQIRGRAVVLLLIAVTHTLSRRLALLYTYMVPVLINNATYRLEFIVFVTVIMFGVFGRFGVNSNKGEAGDNISWAAAFHSCTRI